MVGFNSMLSGENEPKDQVTLALLVVKNGVCILNLYSGRYAAIPCLLFCLFSFRLASAVEEINVTP